MYLIATQGNYKEETDADGHKYYSEYLHIIDGAEGHHDVVTTRCHKKIARYSVGAFHLGYNRLCNYCGTQEDFEAARDQMLERGRKEEAERKRQNELYNAAEQHKRMERIEIMQEFTDILEDLGADVKLRTHYVGADAIILYKGHEFKLGSVAR